MNEPRSWYYADGEHTYGPVPGLGIEALIQHSVISPTTWILAEGSENWMSAHDSPFKECFQAEPVEPAAAKVESLSLPADVLSVTASHEKVSNENDWNKILQNVVTVVLKCLLAAAEWLITAVLNLAKRLKNFSYSRNGRPLIQSGWNGRKIAITTFGSIVAFLLLINLIFVPIDLYEHRRSKPANSIYAQEATALGKLDVLLKRAAQYRHADRNDTIFTEPTVERITDSGVEPEVILLCFEALVKPVPGEETLGNRYEITARYNGEWRAYKVTATPIFFKYDKVTAIRGPSIIETHFDKFGSRANMVPIIVLSMLWYDQR